MKKYWLPIKNDATGTCWNRMTYTVRTVYRNACRIQAPFIWRWVVAQADNGQGSQRNEDIGQQDHGRSSDPCRRWKRWRRLW